MCGACEGSVIITPEIVSQNNSHMNALKYSHTEFRESLKEIPWHRHKTYCSTAKALGVSLNTVQQMLLKRDVCHVHTSSLKPMRTRYQVWSWPYRSSTKMTQANSSTCRISSTSMRNGFISQTMDNALSLQWTRLNPTGMFNTSRS